MLSLHQFGALTWQEVAWYCRGYPSLVYAVILQWDLIRMGPSTLLHV